MSAATWKTQAAQDSEADGSGGRPRATARERWREQVRFYLRALSYFRPDLPLVVLLLVIIAANTGLGLLMAWPMAVLVDSVLSNSLQQGFIYRLFLAPLPESRLGQIIGLAVIGLLMKATQDLLTMARTVVNNRVNYHGLMRVRCDLYRKLQALHLSYHRAQPQGDAIFRLSYDTYGCQAILGVFISTFIAVFSLVFILWTLSSRSVTLTLVALSIAPPLMTANVLFGRRLERRTLEAREVESEYTTTVQRSMSSVGLVQAFCREQDEFQQFHGTIRRNIEAWWRLNWQEMFYWLTVGTIFGVGGAAVFGYGGYLVWHNLSVEPGAGGLTVGDLMIFTSYLGLLWDPLCKITGIGPNIQGGVAGARRVFEVLDRESVITDKPGAVRLPVQPRVLELHDVSFAYGDDKPVLQGVSVRIEPGRMVAFVGSSGVGKSTVLNLLPRFYDPTGGRLTLDGHDMRDIRLQDLRRHLALVLQDSVLLPTTIAENIAYARPDASFEEIREAAELAGAAEFIEALPEGYQSALTEGSMNLSGGQRQRIAVARALLTQAPIIVLDEPTSALDAHHEHLITESLRKLKGRRTIVLVSHRISAVTDCDMIYYMDRGRIAEQGTHEELLAQGGLYRSMAERQLQVDRFHREWRTMPQENFDLPAMLRRELRA
ncbi:MAG TPA: ABC transporter ATP-binding protein [Phycisphaerae bacterium]|mgnify:FL=1|nr:ABC transporter ATP-binding protein [Phycisphaerae bacterium]HPZ99710.1 ABC transporter ATP-binding protein [Phycisphaerae bacterium]HQE26137.1 ABC transporter ATP-binding protein [Phycisphaerae bacterium]